MNSPSVVTQLLLAAAKSACVVSGRRVAGGGREPGLGLVPLAAMAVLVWPYPLGVVIGHPWLPVRGLVLLRLDVQPANI